MERFNATYGGNIVAVRQDAGSELLTAGWHGSPGEIYAQSHHHNELRCAGGAHLQHTSRWRCAGGRYLQHEHRDGELLKREWLFVHEEYKIQQTKNGPIIHYKDWCVCECV